MKPWVTLAKAPSPIGPELVLQQRGEDFALRQGGHILMTNAKHGSEGVMAEAGLRGLTVPKQRVLVGGMGFGQTVRAALDLLPADGVVVVGEISSAVLEWNRGPLAHLHGNSLADPRVEIREGDIANVVKRANSEFHAILLDVDNGPIEMPSTVNAKLYTPTGLKWFHSALTPHGRLVVWSAGRDDKFVAALRKLNFEVDVRDAERNVLFVARRA